MSEGGFDVSSVIAALIGAISGSLGGNFITDWLRRKNEKELLRKTISERYLLQLQDSVESLWFRLDNIRKKDGSLINVSTYYEQSTLYALGVVFAYDRILLLEGVYSQIEQVNPGLGTFLKEKLKNIESEMDNQFRGHSAFYRYDRLALADTVIQRGNGRLQTSSYIEFKKQYEDKNSNIRSFLEPAKQFVASLNGSKVDTIMKELSEIAFRIKGETGIATSIK